MSSTLDSVHNIFRGFDRFWFTIMKFYGLLKHLLYGVELMINWIDWSLQ